MLQVMVIALVWVMRFAPCQTSRPVPALTVSINLPVQPNSPVHIIGLHHDKGELWFSLTNDSGKRVTSVTVGNVSWAPSGCTNGKQSKRSIGHVRFLVSIPPHGREIAFSGQVHYPKLLVFNAQELQAACLLTQFVVDAVYFGDGTTWPEVSPGGPASDLAPFDPEEAAEWAVNPPDISAVVNGLLAVQEIVFDRDGSRSPMEDAQIDSPHLRFTCALEGPKAVCRLPVEGRSEAPKLPSHSE